MTTLSPGKLWGLRRLADDRGLFRMVAVDQRPPIKNPIREKRGTAEAPYEDVAEVKRLLVQELQELSSAMLLDPHYILSQGFTVLSPRKGLIVTLENSIFRETEEGRYSSAIDDWSVEKIKRCGADAVKVLAWYRPDAGAAVNSHQEDFVARVGEACRRYDLPFVLELLVYPFPGEQGATSDYVEMGGKHADHVLESVRIFAEDRFGVDLFKLESPVPARAAPGLGGEGTVEAQALFDSMGRLAARPWVMLSAGADRESFLRVLEHAYAAGASGYLAGRAIWAEPFAAFPDLDAMRAGLRTVSQPYMRALNALTERAATPWHRHPLYLAGVGVPQEGAGFRHAYTGFEG